MHAKGEGNGERAKDPRTKDPRAYKSFKNDDNILTNVERYIPIVTVEDYFVSCGQDLNVANILINLRCM